MQPAEMLTHAELDAICLLETANVTLADGSTDRCLESRPNSETMQSIALCRMCQSLVSEHS